MRYLLSPSYRLRGWTNHLACLERFPIREVTALTPAEFGLLKRCDGQTEVDEERYRTQIANALDRGIIRAVGEVDHPELSPLQRYHFYENRAIRNVNLSVTGRCDFRCRHCFNAADDTHARGVQPATADLLGLIARLDECGVSTFTLTGGEPLLNPDLLRLTQELAQRQLILKRLETNLYHMTPAFVDELMAQGHHPVIYTSFDGVGHHEWLRQVSGSEQRCLDNIALVKSRGLPVTAHICLWRDSLGALRETVRVLEGLGVDGVRITTVEPSLRWVHTAGDQTVDTRAWLGFLEDFLPWWYERETAMDLDIWGFWRHERKTGSFGIVPDLHRAIEAGWDERLPVCYDGYRTPFIDCDGRIMLCMGLSGISKAQGLSWGNVYTDDLYGLLREGPFIEQCQCTVAQMKRANPDCQACPWASHCGYGCRVEALAQGNGLTGTDRRMCIFYREGHYERFCALAKRFGLQ